MTTSGASAALTVASWLRMSPNSFWTTSTSTPLFFAQAFATVVIAALRSLSVQMRIVPADALWPAAGAIEAPTSATSAAASTVSAPIRQVNFLNM
jgi:hypothetical protein